MDSAIIPFVCATNLLPRLHQRICGHLLCIADKESLIWLACSLFWVYSEWLGNAVFLEKELQRTLALL